jgi:syntaxin-binding protein 1
MMTKDQPTPVNTQRLLMRDAIRHKVLKDILGKAGAGQASEEKRFVMLLDPRSARILSTSLLAHDLFEEGVAITENLLKSRQPLPNLEAVYLLEPSERNLACISMDFIEKGPAKYLKAHVFLTRKPNKLEKLALDKLIHSFKRLRVDDKKKSNPPSQQASRLCTLVEVNLDFSAFESNVFHLDLPRSIVELFAGNDKLLQECHDKIASGVTSLCATLNEYPYIRFPTLQDGITERLARTVSTTIDALFEDKNYWFHGDGIHSSLQGRGTLLFIDRRQDLATCLMHEFAYQSLVFDLLQSRDQLVVYGEDNRKAQLNESDPLWKRRLN